MTHTCPSCGFNLAKDEMVERDGWLLDPRGSAWLNGAEVPLSSGQAVILHTVGGESPRWVRTEALLNRASNSERENTVAVQMCIIRRRLRELGIAPPIESRHMRHGGGYRWKVAA